MWPHIFQRTSRAQTQNDVGAHRYKAFLSYGSRDRRLAEWLHRQLESYRPPRQLPSGRDVVALPKRVGRIFKDREEFRTGEDLDSEIALRISESEQLVVLCTPNSASSQSWVSREIDLFRARRPDGRIHAIIGWGTPPECLPAALLKREADRLEQPLAADLRPKKAGGDGRSAAVVKLLAGLLGVEFDQLWNRERRRRRVRQAWSGAIATVLLASASYGFAFWLADQAALVSVVEAERSSDPESKAIASLAALAPRGALVARSGATQARARHELFSAAGYWRPDALLGSVEPPEHGYLSIDYSQETGVFVTRTTTGEAIVWKKGNEVPLGKFENISTTGGQSAISPDGEHFAFVDRSGAVRVAKVDRQEEIWRAGSIERSYSAVTISLDNASLVAGTRSGGVFVWDIGSGTLIDSRDEISASPISSFAWLEGGQRLVVGTEAGDLIVWPVKGSQIDERRLLLGAGVSAIEGQESNLRVAVGLADGTLHIVSLPEMRSVLDIKPHAKAINSIRFGQDDDVFTASDDNAIYQLNLKTSSIVRQFDGHSADVRGIAIVSGGAELLSVSLDKTIRLWDVETGKEKAPARSGAFPISAILVSNDEQKIAVAHEDGSLAIWDVAQKAPVARTVEHLRRIGAISGSAQSGAFVTSSPDGWAVIYSDMDLKGQQRLRHGDVVNSAEFDSSGALVLTASGSLIGTRSDNKVRIWRTFDGALQHEFGPFADSPKLARFSGNDELIAIGDSGGSVRVFETYGRSPILDKRVHGGEVTSLLWVGDGSLLSASRDQTIALTDLKSERTVRLDPLGSEVLFAGIDAEGGRLAGLGMLGSLRFWDLQSRQVLNSFEFGPARVTSVRQSPSQQYILVGLADGTVRLFEMRTGLLLASARFGAAPIGAMAFLEDENAMIIASGAQTLRFWTPRPETLDRNRACQHLVVLASGRSLTQLSFDRNQNACACASSGLLSFAYWRATLAGAFNRTVPVPQGVQLDHSGEYNCY